MRANISSRPSIEHVRQILDYEDATGRLLWRITSGRAVAGREAGHLSKSINYRCVQFGGHFLLTHHVIWALVKGFWPIQLDHSDRDRLNNKISNLRECDQNKNMANQGLSRLNKTGHKGVVLTRSGRYKAMLAGEYLGTASTVEEGAALYEAAAIAKYGEFARGASKGA